MAGCRMVSAHFTREGDRLMQVPSAALAGLAGISFAFIGIGYRLGSRHNIHELHVMAMMAAVGAAVFCPRAIPLIRQAPPSVWWIALIAGMTQYVTVYEIRAALKRGPLTAAWCAVMLGFIPVIIYARLMFGETVTAWHYAAAVAGSACVVAAATLTSPGQASATAGRHVGRVIVFGALLLGILIVNSLTNLATKHLAMVQVDAGQSQMDLFGDLFLAVLYVAALLSVIIDQAVTRRPIPNPRRAAAAGALAGAGAVGGMWLLCSCASAAAGSVFVMSTVSSILFTALVGALWFGEQRTWRWYATLGLGVLAAVLSQGEAIVRAILTSGP